MRTSRLFSPQSIDRSKSLPMLHTLEEHAAHYLMNVLRRKAGDDVIVFDGNGGEYFGRIHSLGRKSVELELLTFQSDDRASPLSVHMAFAALRGDRFEYALQKCCELGATEITPLLSQRSEFKLSPDKVGKRMQHWQGVLRSACEQCGLNIVPCLNPPTKLNEWIASLQAGSKRLLLHPDGEPLSLDSLSTDTTARSWVVASGPEGGFNDDEYGDFKTAGFRPYQFGPRILRAETAPIALLSALQFAAGDSGQQGS